MQMHSFWKKQKANLYLLVYVFLAVAVIVGMYLFGNASLHSDRITQNGYVFDCEQARPLSDTHRYYLAGEWEFFYRALYSENETADGNPIRVPASWAGDPLHTSPYAAGGYATYRCYISGIQHSRALAVTVPNLACAYRIFVDGTLVTESGTLSKEDGGTHSTPASQKEKVYLDSGLHEIVIEVSGDSFSGLYLTPMITDYAYEQQYNNIFFAIRFALIGIILYAAIVLAIFSRISKTRYFSPWLTVLFIALTLRMLISTEGYAVAQPLFGNLSYEKMFLFIFAATFIIKLIAVIYFRDELQLSIDMSSMALLSVLFLLIVITTDFLPNSVYTVYYFLTLQLFSTVADLYLINQLCTELAHGKKNAGLLCAAYLFLFVGLTVDTLYTCGAMPFRCSSFMSVFFAFFALFITVIHAKNALAIYVRAKHASELAHELENANMAVMISQIQPHFLYNALNTIKSLIRRDPKTAEQAVIDFSYYLRGNMDSLSHPEPIPFSTELEHIKHYCNIELLRFSDKLKIVYDIQDDCFQVPTLSVQPLVENAIKHGVTKRPEGGTVTISTKRIPNYHLLTIHDDGIGFDPSVIPDDARSHIGLANTRYRLEKLLHAECTVESTPQIGTTVTVKIPDTEIQKGDDM